MINAAIIGAQVKLVQDFLNVDPSKSLSADEARLKGAFVSSLDQLSRNLGFDSRGEFNKHYTNVAMEQISGLVSSGPGFSGVTVANEISGAPAVPNIGRGGPSGPNLA